MPLLPAHNLDSHTMVSNNIVYFEICKMPCDSVSIIISDCRSNSMFLLPEKVGFEIIADY